MVQQHEAGRRDAAAGAFQSVGTRGAEGASDVNRRLHAVRLGVGRGWLEFRMSLRSAQDQGFYLFMGAGVLVYLFFQRDKTLRGPTCR